MADPFFGTILNVCIDKPIVSKPIQQEFICFLPARHVIHECSDRGAPQGERVSCSCHLSEQEPTSDFGPGQLQLRWFVAFGEIGSGKVKVSSNPGSYKPHLAFEVRSIAVHVTVYLRAHAIDAALGI